MFANTVPFAEDEFEGLITSRSYSRIFDLFLRTEVVPLGPVSSQNFD